MKVVRDPSGKWLEVRRGGGGLIFLGALLALLGLLFAALAYVSPAGMAEGGIGGPATVIAALLVALGGIVALFRRGCRLIPGKNRVRTYWGLPTPVVSSFFPLSDVTSVTVVPQRLVGRDGKPYFHHQVVLERIEGRSVIALFPEADEAAKLATEVAGFGDLPVDSPATGTAEEQDEADQDETAPCLPPEPVILRTSVSREGDGILAVELPPPGGGAGVYVLLGCLLIPVLMGIQALLKLPAGASPAQWLVAMVIIVGLFMAVPLWFGLPWFVDRFQGRTVLRVSPLHGVTLERHGCRGVRSREIPAAEVTAVRCGAPEPNTGGADAGISPALEDERAITVLSEATVLRFGGELPMAERRYIAALVRQALEAG